MVMFWKHIQICKNFVLYVNNSVFWCVDAAFKNTGLERANNLGRDLEWFKEQGYDIPEPMAHCKTYSSAGRRKIETIVSEMIFDNKELEFYK
ncbi:BnaC09g15420D [Brassica napus]|uniref:(rape) hypothetical protein n=1 Tax=Brassica napus TaxID=3708 RepID=A0A078GRP1_BRANA|nr:unnamed protein product [Brassica napus]CDY29145.1 BnaC09g15420D [Brassica napus]